MVKQQTDVWEKKKKRGKGRADSKGKLGGCGTFGCGERALGNETGERLPRAQLGVTTVQVIVPGQILAE